MVIYFKDKSGFADPRDWQLTNGNLISRFVYRASLFKKSGEYPHYTIIGIAHSVKTEDSVEYDVWKFDNFHFSVDSKTHYYYREYQDGCFEYKGANTLQYVKDDLKNVDESAAIFVQDYLVGKLAAMRPGDWNLKVGTEEYQTFQKSKEARMQSVITSNQQGIIRDWTTGKWHEKRTPNEAEHLVLCKHYGIDPLQFAPADWMTVRGKDKPPEPKPVPDQAKTGSNVALATAKSSVVQVPAVQTVSSAVAAAKM
jgi:hypothetical protein